MFVGHGLVAFAIVAGLATWSGTERDRAVAIGILAGAFATIPDLDIVHPLLALAIEPGPLVEAPSRFWTLSTEIHRAATHSVLVGALTALGVTAVAVRPADHSNATVRRPWQCVALGGTALLSGLVAVVWLLDSPLAGAIVALMVAAGIGLAVVARRQGISIHAIGVAAVIGLVSHPFGDLFTGNPPPLLYPVDWDLLTAQVSLHPDPTLHLLAAFMVELATIWLALAVLARLFGVRLREQGGLQSLAGVGYAGAVLVLPAPALDAATPFLVSVLAVGLVGTPLRSTEDRWVWRAVTTGLAAVTIAAVAYGAAYLVL